MNLDDLPDAVLAVDGECRITESNRVASEMSGYAADTLVGLPLAKLLGAREPGAGSGMHDRRWPAAVSLRGVRRMPAQEVVLRRADGTEIPVSMTAAYRKDPQGHVTSAIVAIQSDRRRMRRVASGIEVVSTVSHELRSPLTSVKGYTSLLLNRWDRLKDDQKRMMLEQVHRDADRVTRLITELLDISRIESGRLVLRRQRVYLPSLVHDVLAEVSVEFPGLAARTWFEEPFPHVPADPDKVTQVLTNLVENACKYGSAEGLALKGEVTEDAVVLSVADQGEGIPEDSIEKVFTKFYRGAVGRPSGSGLGLYIARGLVEAHGGTLTATSPPGRGAEFRFTLPLEGGGEPR